MHRQPHQLDVCAIGRLLLVPHRTQQLGRGVRQRRCGGLGHGPIQAGTTDNETPKTALQKGMWKRISEPISSASAGAVVVPRATGGAEHAGARDPRLRAWTSTPPTPRASPGSRRARCRSRSPTRPPTRATVLEQARRLPRRRRRGRGLPRAVPERLRDRRPVPPGHPARRACDGAIAEIVAATADLLPVLVVGAPLVHGTRVSTARSSSTAGGSSASRRSPTCPTYREFYERRWFAPGRRPPR